MGRLLGHTRTYTRIFAKGGAIKNIEARTIETKCQNYRLETKCEKVDKKRKEEVKELSGDREEMKQKYR